MKITPLSHVNGRDARSTFLSRAEVPDHAHFEVPRPALGKLRAGFTRTDFLATIALVAVASALIIAPMRIAQAKSRLGVCTGNLQQVGRAVLLFAGDHQTVLPGVLRMGPGEPWWSYKEEVKGYLGLAGPSSASDRIFACPMDRGYSDPKPFCQTPRFHYSSYVFNGVTLLQTPNIAGWKLGEINQPSRTLLVMEFAAHPPLSWHRSKTGQANAPFYSGAESVTAFTDGHVKLTKMHYDGYNAAYTRDPIAGYDYKYSGK